MANSYKTLGQSAPSAATRTSIYTVPNATQTIVSSIVCCNRSTGTSKVRVSVALANASDDPKQYLFYDLKISPNDQYIATVGMTLDQTDQVYVYSDTGNVSFMLFGDEITVVSQFPTQQNVIINGGGDFFQRTDPTVLTSVSDDTYGPDRWNILTQTTTIRIQQTTGDTAPNAIRIQQNQASAQRCGMIQFVENVSSRPLRAQSVYVSSRINCSSSQAIRIAILESTGLADSGVISDVVNDWTSSTYTSGNFFISSNLTVTAVSSVTPTASTWTSLNVSGTVSSSCNNIAVMIWTEGTAAQNVTLDITQVSLTQGNATQLWLPRPVQQELALCQRYYEKSYNVEVPPATVTAIGACVTIQNGTVHITTIFFKERKFRNVTSATFYSTVTGASAKWRNTTSGADVTQSLNNQGSTCIASVTTGGTDGQAMAGHWTVETEM